MLPCSFPSCLFHVFSVIDSKNQPVCLTLLVCLWIYLKTPSTLSGVDVATRVDDYEVD